jgi:ATP-dependent helicase/nuclease subunit A
MTESPASGSRPPADEAQRVAALDLERSFIVQAPAGSGKTELLTQRLLKLLARVPRPERVLAITFTRKATQEMRARILWRLRQARAGTVPEPHEAAAVRLAGEVLANDARHGWNLLDQPGRLRILTIDALCAQLLQRSPEHGAAVSGLRLLEQPRALYRKAVRRLLDDLDDPDAFDGGAALHASLVRVLLHLDGDVQRLEDLLMDMLQIRDQWTDLLVGRAGGGMHDSLRHVLRQRQAAELEAFRRALGRDGFDRAVALVQDIGAAVDAADHPAARLAALPAGTDPEHALWQAYWLAQVLTRADGQPRGRTAVKPGLFPGAGSDQRPQIDALSEHYQHWFDSSAARAAIERIARHPPLAEEPLAARSGEDAAGSRAGDPVLNDVLALLTVLLAELNLTMGEAGATDFQHLAQAALHCLETEPDGGVSPVLLAEDLRLEHLLVDEFQDTSHTQHRLIRLLTEGWTPGDGRTLFLVGDPMQSIYRFRQADVGLFTRVVRDGRLGQVPVDVLQLTANFRSRAEIIDWANTQFRTIFPTEDRRDSGAVAYHAAVAQRNPGGSVQLHGLTRDRTPEDEAREIADLIDAYRQTGDDPLIAVLVRARSHLLAIARELGRRAIVFDAVQIDPLAGRPVIQDLLALARVLVQPADRVAWLAVLRAPWCALTVPELHRAAGEDRHADLLARLANAPADEGLGAGARERLQRLHDVLRQAFDQAAARPLAERVERAWLQLGGPHCYAGAEELENAAACLGLLDALERESPAELIERLGESLAELYASGRPSRVQLMTVHKAKGLEFDVVIVPGMHRTTGRNDPRLVMAQQFVLDTEAEARAGADSKARAGAEARAVPKAKPEPTPKLRSEPVPKSEPEPERAAPTACCWPPSPPGATAARPCTTTSGPWTPSASATNCSGCCTSPPPGRKTICTCSAASAGTRRAASPFPPAASWTCCARPS